MSSLLSAEAKYGYIPGLDGMRAFAVMIVIIAHAGLEHLFPGGFGVTVFFFISGFLITRLLLAETEKHGRIGLKNFYIRRFLRLLPALYFMLLVSGIGLWALGNTRTLVEMVTAATYTMNYHYIWHAFVDKPQIGPWGHLWSLAVEEHFYLMFPLLLILFRKRLDLALKASIAICGLALTWRLITFYGLNFPAKYNYAATDTRLDSIVYGCVLSLMMHVKPQSKILKKTTGLLPLFLAALVILFCFIYRDEGFRQTFRYSLQGMALFVFFRNLYFLPKIKFLIPILEWSPIAWTGKISYGLYLWHIPVALVLDQYTPIEYATVEFLLLAVFLTYAVSWFSFRYVEKPIVGLRRKFGSHVVTKPSKTPPANAQPAAEISA